MLNEISAPRLYGGFSCIPELDAYARRWSEYTECYRVYRLWEDADIEAAKCGWDPRCVLAYRCIREREEKDLILCMLDDIRPHANARWKKVLRALPDT